MNITGIYAAFPSTPPIVWRPVLPQPATKLNHVNYKIYYISPCSYMKNLPKPYQSQTTAWCNEIVSTHFMNPIRQMCTTHPHTDMTLFAKDLRKKRAISVALIGLIVLGLNSVLSTGAMITAGISNMRTKASVKEALVKQAKTDELLRYITTDLYNLTQEFERIGERIETFEKAIIPFLTQTSIFASRMTTFKRILTRANYDARSGILSHDLIEFLGLKLPCGSRCVLSHVDLNSCFLNLMDNSINLDIIVPESDPKTTLLEADAFILVSKTSARICSSKYTGPRYLLLSKDTGKVCVLPATYKLSDRIPIGKRCIDVKEHYNLQTLWNVSTRPK